ncbi:heparan-sulfate 6-O-sulfotransferase 3 [Manis pentadactyla]|uniref:heparan-sulfate 6-O-sulfotransferase 3 n=1 Tax=Manis pentadactyla TaxID=143292 RepID=UPI00255C4A63|nr:heparan-sulfate 6-O-sulfotransferase 3 [Manis pentadactyla]
MKQTPPWLSWNVCLRLKFRAGRLPGPARREQTQEPISQPSLGFQVALSSGARCQSSRNGPVLSSLTVAGHISALNFYYITMLRDPVSRYLSEWKHVQRGATWKTSLHMCDGRSPTADELPTCYPGDDWSGVSLREFMDCTYNLANNRQVRMLADLSLVGCYDLTFMNESERNAVLLQSAKNNLKNMAFFGLTEFQRKTQFLFERTFNLKFISPFTQFNITRASNVDINEGARQRIEELNFLDMQLYEYAKDLFRQRYHHTKQLERQRDRQKRREERRLQREHRGHRWPKEAGDVEGAVTEDYNSQVVRW